MYFARLSLQMTKRDSEDDTLNFECIIADHISVIGRFRNERYNQPKAETSSWSITRIQLMQ